MSKASDPQPDPKPGSAEIWPLVLADIKARVDAGRVKYGTTLRAGNGRDPLLDAYQEAIDLVMYLRQELAERGR